MIASVIHTVEQKHYCWLLFDVSVLFDGTSSWALAWHSCLRSSQLTCLNRGTGSSASSKPNTSTKPSSRPTSTSGTPSAVMSYVSKANTPTSSQIKVERWWYHLLLHKSITFKWWKFVMFKYCSTAHDVLHQIKAIMDNHTALAHIIIIIIIIIIDDLLITLSRSP